MTIQQVAGELGCSAMTVRRLIKAKKLTPVNQPLPGVMSRARRLLFRAEDVAAFKHAATDPDSHPRP